MSRFSTYLLWIIFFSHYTIHTYNATYMNSYFGLSKTLNDKMIEEKRNNDFNLSGKTKKWHIDEHIFHKSVIHIPLKIEMTIDPICIY